MKDLPQIPKMMAASQLDPDIPPKVIVTEGPDGSEATVPEPKLAGFDLNGLKDQTQLPPHPGPPTLKFAGGGQNRAMFSRYVKCVLCIVMQVTK